MQEYLKHKNWYSRATKKLKRKYGKDYKLFAALLASTSPRFQIKRNINTAENIHSDFKANPEKCINFFLKDKRKALKHYKLLPAHYNNIIRSLLHDFTGKADFQLSGLKVNAFFQNLTGNKKAVTIDIWMLRYFGDTRQQISIGPYKRYTRIIRKLAIREGLEPCELQAILWEKTRAKAGFNPSSFEKHI